MKPLYIYTLAFLLPFLSLSLKAQDFSGKISKAATSYQSGDLEDARFNLQQAMADIDAEIGKEILVLLPSSLGSMTSKTEEDNYSGNSLGFAGLYVHRMYEDQNKNEANIDIITDSPLISGINAILSLPSMMIQGDDDQKVIKLENYKALMQKSKDESGVISYSIQLPFGQSLLTLNCNGSFQESEVLSLANSIPVSKIMEVVE